MSCNRLLLVCTVVFYRHWNMSNSDACVGIIDNTSIRNYNLLMKATLIFKHKTIYDDGAVLQAVVWKLPERVSGSLHDYKYRLYYGDNKRELGFDNERNKGDHCHIDDIELPYRLISPAQLMEDFLAGVTILREE